MTAVLLPNGKQQFIDINGKPLVGGKVGMYVPNTLIFKNTWQNSGETVLNTNPIILDSRGQALIYGSGLYRQIVKDSLGNLIWDELVTAPGTNNRAFVPPANAPSLIDYPSLPFVTPEMFGAVADGTTDDTSAIQDALDWLGNNRGGVLIFGLADYMVRTGPVIVPNGVTIKGVAPWQGQWAQGGNATWQTTRLLNDSNNDTVLIETLNSGVENIIFAAPQPIIQCGNISGGGITTPGAFYPGFGLTDGTYNLTIAGGFGSGATGTITILNGSAAHCTVTGVGSGYGSSPLALPLVTATITGGNQTGAHIRLGNGLTSNKISGCAFFSKDFGILMNKDQIIRNLTGSYSAGNQNLPQTNTVGYQVGMVITNATKSQSIRQLNQITSINPGAAIRAVYGVDASSAGTTDTIIAGNFIYFNDLEISSCSFYGTTYWQIYLNATAEGLNISDNIFIDPTGGCVFVYSAPTFTFCRNNIDGVFKNGQLATQFLEPPNVFETNFVGNLTGPDAGTTAFYISGRLVFGGSIVPSAMHMAANQVYAPCPRGIWLESVTKATLESNWISVTPPMNGDATAGYLTGKTDINTVGNTFIFGGDAEPQGVSYWDMASQQNWIIGTRGTQFPYVRVSADYVIQWYDYNIEVDTTAGDVTLTLPLPAIVPVAGTAYLIANGGLEFFAFKTDATGNALKYSGNGANVNGVPTYTVTTAQLGNGTAKFSPSGNWYVF